MKKILMTVMSFVMFISLSTVAFGEENSTQQPLSPEQIQVKFLEFSEKYELNEPFSPEDEAFVREYANPVQPEVGTYSLPWGTGKHFIGYGLGNYSNVRTEGYLRVTLGWASNTVEVNMNTTDTNATYHSKMGNSLDFQGFGVLGSDGIGIVANFTLEGENSNSNFHKFLDERTFLASVAFWVANPRGYVMDNGLTSQTIGTSYD